MRKDGQTDMTKLIAAFLHHVALQEKKLDDSSRLDFVEIAFVPDVLPSFFRSWSG